MNLENDLVRTLEQTGRVWLRNAVSEEGLRYLAAAMDQTRAGQRLGATPALQRALKPSGDLMTAVRRLDPGARVVRAVAFNKSEQANWGVPWHQDRVIAVDQRAEVSNFRNWSDKAGIWHCEATEVILDQMLFVRVHLDDSDEANGAMEIALGSHTRGIVPAALAEEVAAEFPRELCSARRGDVLVLKMLTLHASKPARVQSGRRVLRLDFASCDLPPPLAWMHVD